MQKQNEQQTPHDIAVTLALLAEFVALPGPPGQEQAVCTALVSYIASYGLISWTDAKGNLLVGTEGMRDGVEKPKVLVTAHMDEIAAMVTGIETDGALRVSPLGGSFPYKWGEGPVEIMAGRVDTPTFVRGVLSFGSIHTTSPASVAQNVREGRTVTWEMARVQTGLTPQALQALQVRPGSRVIVARDRRKLWPFGRDLVASYFLDDRADLVAWLLALKQLKAEGITGVLFAATVSEEVGGEGAQYIMQTLRPDICVALEIGPVTPDAAFEVDAMPTVWVSDAYSTTNPIDLELLATATAKAGLHLHHQAVTRGGSDASCAASRGLCARPVTIAFAADNSHGFEIMHGGAIDNLAKLLLAYLKSVQ